MNDHSHDEHRQGGGRSNWVFWGFLLIAGYFLFTEHRAHMVQYLPFLLLLACPLMHLFHGHGGHHHHGADKSAPEGKREPSQTLGQDTKPGDRHDS